MLVRIITEYIFRWAIEENKKAIKVNNDVRCPMIQLYLRGHLWWYEMLYIRDLSEARGLKINDNLQIYYICFQIPTILSEFTDLVSTKQKLLNFIVKNIGDIITYFSSQNYIISHKNVG